MLAFAPAAKHRLDILWHKLTGAGHQGRTVPAHISSRSHSQEEQHEQHHPRHRSVTFDGLGRRGELIAVGIFADNLAVSPVQLVNNMRRIRVASFVVEETMRFAARTGVCAWTEESPSEDTAESVCEMLSGEAGFKWFARKETQSRGQ